MAENSVFSNETGQVMFGSGGLIYKVPYSTGHYRNADGGNYYIKFSGLELKDEYSYIYSLVDVPPDAGVVALSSLYQSTTNRAENTGSNGIVLQLNTMEDGARITKPHAKRDLVYRGFKDLIYTIKTGSNLSPSIIDRGSESLLEGDRDVFILGAGGDRNSNFINSSSPTATPSTYIFGGLSMFSRELSDNEIRHIFNLGIFNPPLASQGLHARYIFNSAEILTIGGVDKVGVRDRSGNNRHGQIMNLPAGTLQEQLDWANANLFVPFIS